MYYIYTYIYIYKDMPNVFFFDFQFVWGDVQSYVVFDVDCEDCNVGHREFTGNGCYQDSKTGVCLLGSMVQWYINHEDLF